MDWDPREGFNYLFKVDYLLPSLLVVSSQPLLKHFGSFEPLSRDLYSHEEVTVNC